MSEKKFRNSDLDIMHIGRRGLQGVKKSLVWITLIVILILILIFGLQLNKQEEVQILENLEEHYLYKDYEFSDDKKVIEVGFQPLLIPTSLISEVMKRDKILKEELGKQGYSIKFHEFLKGDDINYFIEKEDLEVGIGGDMPAIRAISTGRAVAVSLTQEGPVSIVSRDLQEVQELRGKKVGYALGSSTHFYLLNTLEKNNIDVEEVVLVQMDVNEMAEALRNKDIDAFSAWEPIPTIALNKYPEFIITHRGISHGFLYIKKEIMQENPDIARLLVASEIRALRWIRGSKDNIDLAALWVFETVKKFDPESELPISELVYLAKKDLVGILTKEYPRIDSELLSDNGVIKNEFEFLLELGLIPMDTEWEKVKEGFNQEIIEEVINNPEKYRLFEGGINNGN